MSDKRKVPNTKIRDGYYHFRKRVPTDLLGDPAFGNKKEFQKPLGTKNRNLAIKLAAGALTEYERICAAARARRSDPRQTSKPPRPSVINDELLEFIARQHRDMIVHHDAQTRRARGHEGQDSLTADYLEYQDEIDDSRAERYQALKRRDYKQVEEIAVRALQREGVAEPRKHPKFNSLSDLLIEAELDALRAVQGHIDLGSFEPEPQTERLRNAPTEHPQRSGTRLSEVMDSYFRVTDCSADWRKKVERAVDSFTASQGVIPVERITRRNITDWVQELLEQPAYATQKGAAASTKVSPNTVRDGSLAALKRLLQHAVDRTFIDGNPASSVRVPHASRKGKKRRPFELPELQQLFKFPVFTGCKSTTFINTPGATQLDDHRYWAPLIALYTGARASEIAQLRVRDVQSESGVAFLRIVIDEDDDENSLKSSAAYRRVPVHSELSKLGLLEYVERRRQASDDRLFPKWKRAANGRYSDSRSQRNFNEQICPRVSTHDPKPTFHSFRHNAKSALGAASVSTQIQNFLLGHEQTGQDKNYLHPPAIDRLADAVEEIKYAGLDLSHLYPENRA